MDVKGSTTAVFNRNVFQKQIRVRFIGISHRVKSGMYGIVGGGGEKNKVKQLNIASLDFNAIPCAIPRSINGNARGINTTQRNLF